VPNGRLATALDVARMVLYLASDDSAYSTGSEFVVDGGMTAGFEPSGTGEAGDDRCDRVDRVVVEDVVREAPPLTTFHEGVADLVDRTDQQYGLARTV